MEEKLPMICQVGLSFVILQKRLSNGSANLQYHVSMYNDGSIFTEEILSKPAEDETLNIAHANNFEEFSGKFPEHAEMIKKFMINNKIPMPRWELRS
jgi:hypothetical protein